MVQSAPAKENLNKFEKLKAEKDGLQIKKELENFAQIGWEAMEENDRLYRLKWVGLFYRAVTPGKFMMRLRLPNGIITSGQMRVLADIVQRYGNDGNADITTRQNLQLRQFHIEDVPDIFNRLQQAGLTSIQSGMDNVRNITGSPVAGIDADELIDTRGLCRKVQDMITNNGDGNPSFSNLPRKFNIAIAGCRDNSVHAEINDLAFVPAYKNDTIGFNIIVGGFFSAKACIAAIPLNAWVDPRDVVAVCEAILLLYRDYGLRANRQKSRIWYLIEEWGIEKFRAEVEKRLGFPLQTAAEKDEILWDKRDHVGIHAQKQPGLNYIGLHVPVGRMFPQEMFDLARIADVYGSGEIRLTVEQNIIIPNVPDSRIAPLLKEPLLQRFAVNPDNLSRGLVSCTGNQFCGFALIETKNRALIIIQELERELIQPQPVRIHWTGCPNSCGQPQVADIGLMGTKTRKDGKAVEGVDIYLGGKVGKHAQLGTCAMKGIPCEDLKPVLRDLLIQHFGAQPLPPGQTKANLTPLATLPSEGRVGQYSPLPPPLKSGAGGIGEGLGERSNGNGHRAATTPVIEPPVPTQKAAEPAVISFANSGKEIACTSNDFILDVAEKAGIDLASSCRTGTCGTCKQKLLAGEVKYDGDPDALEEGDRSSGLILTCIGQPIGRVVIDA
jgi:ferredoxin-nitrite reductase